jgi:uncharacterized membrane protein YozB (DUF420 family)
MERVDVAVDRSGRAYEKYGWMILSASAILGVFAAVLTTMPPIYVFSSAIFERTCPIMGALGTALVGFNILALVMTLIPYKRGEKWAWYTLWLLPLQWVSQFVFSPDVPYLILALLTTVGLVLPYQRFFSASQEEPSRVR